jgi:hypothetical protein
MSTQCAFIQMQTEGDGRWPVFKCSQCSLVVSAPSAPIAICRLNASTEQPPTHGPGTELKKLLAKVGIVSSPDCSCNARAAEMDRQGVEWCEANIDTIVGWLREQAEARGLPFLDIAGRLLVRRAIANARRHA